jgi:sortase (surface protein transpeptidase)
MSRRALWLPAALLAVGLGALGLGVVEMATGGVPSMPVMTPVPKPTPGTTTLVPSEAGKDPEEAKKRTPTWAEPGRITVPSIGVQARVSALGLTEDGELEVPEDPWLVGWWRGGSRPGEEGPAVLVGHRDSRTGPAVFYRVGDLVSGDEIVVDDMNGRTATFIVTRTEQVDREAFPTDRVYGKTESPELRILSCGPGSYDEETREYEENVIVYARLV